MTNKIRTEDFVQLALSLKPILDLHGVPAALHHSLVSDLVFQFASFVDDKSGSTFHEDVFALLDVHSDALREENPRGDSRIAELRVTFGKGRKVEMNLLRSHLENDRSHLMMDLEMAFGLRGIHELDSEDVDVDARWTKLLQKRGGIESVSARPAGAAGRQEWVSVPLQDSEHDSPGQSIDWLYARITTSAKDWM